MRIINDELWGQFNAELSQDSNARRALNFAKDWAEEMELSLTKADEADTVVTHAELSVIADLAAKRTAAREEHRFTMTGFTYAVAREILVRCWYAGAALKIATSHAMTAAPAKL